MMIKQQALTRAPCARRVAAAPLPLKNLRKCLITKFQPDEPQRTASRAETATHRTTFKCTHHLAFGEVLGVVGSAAELGGWDLANCLSLTWGEGDCWVGTAQLPNDMSVEFKCVVLHSKDRTFKSWATLCGPDNVKLHVRPGARVEQGPLSVRVDQTTTGPTPACQGPAAQDLAFGTPASTPASRAATEHEHASSGGVMDPVRDLAARATDTLRAGAASIVGGTEGRTHELGFGWEIDPADPGDEAIMTPHQAAEPRIARHIQSDTLSTDRALAQSHGQEAPDIANLAYLHEGSLQHPLTHAPFNAAVAVGPASEGPAATTTLWDQGGEKPTARHDTTSRSLPRTAARNIAQPAKNLVTQVSNFMTGPTTSLDVNDQDVDEDEGTFASVLPVADLLSDVPASPEEHDAPLETHAADAANNARSHTAAATAHPVARGSGGAEGAGEEGAGMRPTEALGYTVPHQQRGGDVGGGARAVSGRGSGVAPKLGAHHVDDPGSAPESGA